MSSGLKIDMECGGLDTAFAQRGSTRWLLSIGAARRAAPSKAASSRAHSILIGDPCRGVPRGRLNVE